MTNETVAARVAAAKDRWAEFKRRWRELGLPGSEYSPGDFIACLLLSQVEGGVDEVASRVRAAAEMFAALKRDSRLSGALIGSDAPAVCSLALVNGETGEAVAAPALTAKPQPEMMGCPHCHHEFAACRAGEYATDDLEGEPLTAGAASTIEPVTECPHCEHAFVACEAGEYVAPAAEAPARPEALPMVEASVPAAASSGGCIHVGSDGRCAACTADETVECSSYDCEAQIIAAKAHRCKNFDDCGIEVCDEHAEDGLSEHGYCDDCRTLECDGCQDEVEAGTEKRCTNSDCAEKAALCDECAPRLLDEAGRCSHCTGSEDRDCSGCEHDFTSARLTACKNIDDCENEFCGDCRGGSLTVYGYCDDCHAFECDGCQADIEAGEERYCANKACPNKGKGFCSECVGRLFTDDGHCENCAA